MLPFAQRPWAKTVAATVITLSIVGAICLALYLHSIDSLHLSEIVGIFLLLLTIVPPNAAIVLRKPGEETPVQQTHVQHIR
jgi:uncharacterized membrane protein YfcA